MILVPTVCSLLQVYINQPSNSSTLFRVPFELSPTIEIYPTNIKYVHYNDKIIVFDCKGGRMKTASILTMHDVLIFSVPISEVERLWSRFQQLGPNDEGTVESEVFQHPSFTTDPFLRQVNNVVPM